MQSGVITIQDRRLYTDALVVIHEAHTLDRNLSQQILVLDGNHRVSVFIHCSALQAGDGDADDLEHVTGEFVEPRDAAHDPEENN